MNDRLDEKQERWLAADLDAASGDSFEREVLADPDLAEAAYAALVLNEALSEAADETVKEAATSSRWVVTPQRWAWAGGLMAALLAFVILMPSTDDISGDLPLRLRGAGDAGAAIGSAPQGEMDHFPVEFRWHPADPTRETRYRWELYDGQAKLRSVAIVADSVLVRPASETPSDSLGNWLWLVVELRPDGLEGPTSAAVKFAVQAKEQK